MTYKNSFFKSALNYEGKVLAGYKYQIEVQNELLKKIQSLLPAHLASHALYCVASNKKVILYTDSATWSSQLRFYHQTILQGVSTISRENFEAVHIKIIPQVVEKKTAQLKHIPSTENIDQIFLHAKNQTDAKLKSALTKLGKTLKKKL